MTVEEILKKLGLENASEKLKQETIADVVQVVEGRVLSMVEDVMTPEQTREFESLTPDNPDEAILWLKNNIPDADSLYTATMRDYVFELSDGMEDVMNRAREKRENSN